MMVRFKPAAFFAECFQDSNGDYWPSKEAYDDWDVHGHQQENLNKWVTYEEVGGIYSFNFSDSGGNSSWGFDVLTQEEYPEYYL